jgi:hypothetical protein
MEPKSFWTIPRRKYLASKLGELSVVLVAGGVLSDVFAKLGALFKLGVILFAAVLLGVSVLLYPDKEER